MSGKPVKKHATTTDFYTCSAEEMQNSLYKTMKHYRIFEVHENAAPSAPRELCESAEAKYRAICNSAKAEPDKGETDKFII